MEIRENRDALDKTISTQAFKTAVDILQTEDAINARRLVLEKLEGRDPSDWTDEEVRQAEIVCRTYDVVGSMIENAMMPESYIVEPWNDSIQKTWKILASMVEDYRAERKAENLWTRYEALNKRAEDFMKKVLQARS
ncbi:MAG: hypothetical protein KIT43_05995 [Bauldia sp.]|nr:hypothetical protein [Bauldia sp.]